VCFSLPVFPRYRVFVNLLKYDAMYCSVALLCKILTFLWKFVTCAVSRDFVFKSTLMLYGSITSYHFQPIHVHVPANSCACAELFCALTNVSNKFVFRRFPLRGGSSPLNPCVRPCLGHHEGRRVFREGPKFFKLCPVVLNYVQHIFLGGRKIFQGASFPAPLWLRAWKALRIGFS